MSFLSQSNSGRNDVSSYVLTICLVLLSYGFLGSLPLLIDLKLAGVDLQEMRSLQEMGRILGKNRLLFHLLLPFVFAFFSIVLSIKYFHKRTFLSLLTTSKNFRWKRFFTTFSIWWLIMSIFLLVTFASLDELKWNFIPEKFFVLVLISFLIIPIQTAAEEILFRGYLAQSIFRKTGSIFHMIMTTSLFFALMHAFNPEVATLGYGILMYYFLTGAFLAIMTVMDDGMELSMGYHAANNVFTAIMITNNWQAFQTDALFIDSSVPSFGIDSLLTLLILQPLMLFIFSKKYKWENWKKILPGKNRN
jgi:membrane protease YdiL (CAAX protease family)